MIYLWAPTSISLARTVAVVVPSPAIVLVCVVACLIICAAAFSNSSSIYTKSLTVAPSLVIIGSFPFWWRITFRPFGPRVAATLSARVFTPFNTFAFSSARDSNLHLGTRHLSFLFLFTHYNILICNVKLFLFFIVSQRRGFCTNRFRCIDGCGS